MKNARKLYTKGDLETLAQRCFTAFKRANDPSLNAEILYWFVRGRSNAAIAEKLHTSVDYIETQQTAWLVKLGAPDGVRAQKIWDNQRAWILNYFYQQSFAAMPAAGLNRDVGKLQGEWEGLPNAERFLSIQPPIPITKIEVPEPIPAIAPRKAPKKVTGETVQHVVRGKGRQRVGVGG